METFVKYEEIFDRIRKLEEKIKSMELDIKKLRQFANNNPLYDLDYAYEDDDEE